MQPIIKPPIWRVNRGQRLAQRLAFYSVHPGGSNVWNAVDGQEATSTAPLIQSPYGQALNVNAEGTVAPTFGYAPVVGSLGGGLGDVTVAAVANPTPSSTNPGVLWSQRTGASPFAQLDFIANYTFTGAGYGNLCCFVQSQANYSWGAETDQTAVDGNWHVYILTISGGVPSIYVDGKSNVYSTRPADGVSWYDPTQTVRVGSFAQTDGGYQANCGIALTAAWNRALSLDEIQAFTRDPWLPLRPNWTTPERRLFAAPASTTNLAIAKSAPRPTPNVLAGRGESARAASNAPKPAALMQATTGAGNGLRMSTASGPIADTSIAGSFGSPRMAIAAMAPRPVGSGAAKAGAGVVVAGNAPRAKASLAAARGTALRVSARTAAPTGGQGVLPVAPVLFVAESGTITAIAPRPTMTSRIAFGTIPSAPTLSAVIPPSAPLLSLPPAQQAPLPTAKIAAARGESVSAKSVAARPTPKATAARGASLSATAAARKPVASVGTHGSNPDYASVAATAPRSIAKCLVAPGESLRVATQAPKPAFTGSAQTGKSAQIRAAAARPTGAGHLLQGEQIAVIATAPKPNGASRTTGGGAALNVRAVAARPIAVSRISMGSGVTVASIAPRPTAVAGAAEGSRATISQAAAKPTGSVAARRGEAAMAAATTAMPARAASATVGNSGKISAAAPRGIASTAAQLGEAVSIKAIAPKPSLSGRGTEGAAALMAASASRPRAVIAVERPETAIASTATPKPTATIHVSVGEVARVLAATARPIVISTMARGEPVVVKAIAPMVSASVSAERGLAGTVRGISPKPIATGGVIAPVSARSIAIAGASPLPRSIIRTLTTTLTEQPVSGTAPSGCLCN